MKKGLGLVCAAASAALVGCSGNSTSGNGIFNQPAPRIRAINALDGVSTATWNVTGQNNVTFPSIPYGTATGNLLSPYVILNERSAQNIDFYNVAAPTVVVTSASHGFVFKDKVTAIAYGSSPAGTLVLQDQTSGSTNGPNVRVVDVAQQEGPVDVFITPTGQPQTSPTVLQPGGADPAQPASGGYAYSSVGTAGAYTVNVYPQGNDTGTPLYTFSLNLGGSDVWSLYLIDPATSGGVTVPLAIQDNDPNAD